MSTIIAYLIVILSNYTVESSTIEESFAQADFVAVIKMADFSSTNSKYLSFRVIESYKGFHKYVLIPKQYFDEGDTNDYILFAKMDKHYASDVLIKIQIDKVVIDTKNFLLNLPCKDTNKIRKDAICRRDNDPVCGCDGMTYGNLCETWKNGVLRFYPGECENN